MQHSDVQQCLLNDPPASTLIMLITSYAFNIFELCNAAGTPRSVGRWRPTQCESGRRQRVMQVRGRGDRLPCLADLLNFEKR